MNCDCSYNILQYIGDSVYCDIMRQDRGVATATEIVLIDTLILKSSSAELTTYVEDTLDHIFEG